MGWGGGGGGGGEGRLTNIVAATYEGGSKIPQKMNVYV